MATSSSIPRWVGRLLQAVLALGVALSIYETHWLNAAVIAGILLLTLLPTLLGRRFSIYIPAEFELLTIVFIFAALRGRGEQASAADTGHSRLTSQQCNRLLYRVTSSKPVDAAAQTR